MTRRRLLQRRRVVFRKSAPRSPSPRRGSSLNGATVLLFFTSSTRKPSLLMLSSTLRASARVSLHFYGMCQQPKILVNVTLITSPRQPCKRYTDLLPQTTLEAAYYGVCSPATRSPRSTLTGRWRTSTCAPLLLSSWWHPVTAVVVEPNR